MVLKQLFPFFKVRCSIPYHLSITLAVVDKLNFVPNTVEHGRCIDTIDVQTMLFTLIKRSSLVSLLQKDVIASWCQGPML